MPELDVFENMEGFLADKIGVARLANVQEAVLFKIAVVSIADAVKVNKF